MVTAQYSPAVVSFAEWATIKGISGDDAASSADPDADGVPNLLEYHFGTSPLLSNSVASPYVVSGTLSGQPTLLLTHRRAKASTAAVVYQTTSDLANPASWIAISPSPASTVVDPDVDHDGLVELVTVAIPLPTATPGLFVRIQISP